MSAWLKGITVDEAETGESSLGGAAHVLDYAGPCEIDFDRLPSKGQ